MYIQHRWIVVDRDFPGIFDKDLHPKKVNHSLCMACGTNLSSALFFFDELIGSDR